MFFNGRDIGFELSDPIFLLSEGKTEMKDSLKCKSCITPLKSEKVMCTFCAFAACTNCTKKTRPYPQSTLD